MRIPSWVILAYLLGDLGVFSRHIQPHFWDNRCLGLPQQGLQRQTAIFARMLQDAAAVSQRETNVVGTKRGCVVSGKIFEKSANSGKRLENPGNTLERLGACITQLFEDVRGFRSITKHAYILF